MELIPMLMCAVLLAAIAWGFYKGSKEAKVKSPFAINHANISQPVREIVKTFSEKGRWKFEIPANEKPRSDGLCETTFMDVVTGEKVRTCCLVGYATILNYTYIPYKFNKFFLPSWMNADEKTFVEEEINKLFSNNAKRIRKIQEYRYNKNQKRLDFQKAQERQRLIEIYIK